MHPRHSLLVASIALVGLAIAAAGAPVAAQEDAEAEIEVVDGHVVDTPEETIDLDDASGTFTVDSVLVVKPGEEFDVAISGVDRATLTLYNSDEEIAESRQLRPDYDYHCPDNVCKFQTNSPHPAGTYLLALEGDDVIQSIQPVVVEGYDLSVDAPAEVERGETATVTLDVNYTALDDSPADVAVALHRDDTVYEATATDYESIDGGERYEVSLPFADAQTGSYDVYAAARSDAEVEDSRTALAVASGATLEVTEGSGDGNQNESDQNDGDDSSSGGGIPAPDDGSNDGDGEDGTDGDDGSDAQDDTDGQPDDADENDGTDADDGTNDGESGETDDDAAAGDAEDDVIDPNADDGDEDDEQSDETPGFGVLAFLAALLAVVGRAAFAER